MAESAFTFGSLSGSWLTLGFFAAMFAGLGWVIARAIRQRTGERAAARVCGGLVFLVPVTLLWMTTVNGFYSVETMPDRLRLTYLSGLTTELVFSDVALVNEQPWYKGRWRLVIIDGAGRRYESATSDRTVVDRAVHGLNAALGRR